MADLQITCVTRTAPTHEAITGVGGLGWWTSVDQIIRLIDARANTYYTLFGRKRADVLVVNGPTKRYIRTHADGLPNDNLLAFPGCPGH